MESSLIEWKVDMDSPTDTHRHLSHLIGLYPGYAITSFDASIQSTGTKYTKAEVLDAAETSLFHRGNGTGPDADAGWEKVWRAACWAQLANATEFYHELSVRYSTRWDGLRRGPDFPVTNVVCDRSELWRKPIQSLPSPGNWRNFPDRC